MNLITISAEIQLTDGSRPVKAHADVRFEFSGGSLTNYGFAVIEKDGKPPWVGFPQKQGKIPGKYFSIVDADGEVRKRICEIILEAYQKAKEQRAA
jgi:hypothetical protein